MRQPRLLRLCQDMNINMPCTQGDAGLPCHTLPCFNIIMVPRIRSETSRQTHCMSLQLLGACPIRQTTDQAALYNTTDRVASTGMCLCTACCTAAPAALAMHPSTTPARCESAQRWHADCPTPPNDDHWSHQAAPKFEQSCRACKGNAMADQHSFVQADGQHVRGLLTGQEAESSRCY